MAVVMKSSDVDVLVPFETEWLGIAELCRLDMAFCCKKILPPFVFTKTIAVVLVGSLSSDCSLRMLRWFVRSGARVKSLSFFGVFPKGVDLETLLEPQASNLQKIKVESLFLDGNWFNVGSLIKMCDNLEEIHFVDCMLSDQEFAEMLRECSLENKLLLNTLTLKDCAGHGAAGLSKLAADEIQKARCKQLRNLCLSGTRNLSRDGYKSVFSSCPQLTSLDLSFCAHVSFDDLRDLPAECPHLTSLSLKGCLRLTAETHDYLLTRCTKLREFDCTDTYVLDAKVSVVPNRPKVLYSSEWRQTYLYYVYSPQCDRLVMVCIGVHRYYGFYRCVRFGDSPFPAPCYNKYFELGGVAIAIYYRELIWRILRDPAGEVTPFRIWFNIRRLWRYEESLNTNPLVRNWLKSFGALLLMCFFFPCVRVWSWFEMLREYCGGVSGEGGSFEL